MRRSVASLALLLSAALIGSAWAADSKPPDTVGPFIAFCKTDFEACFSKIADTGLEATMQEVMGPPSGTFCAAPTNIAPRLRAQAVVDWLGQNSATAGFSIRDGLMAANKALWNCQTSIPNGITSEGVPDTTALYMAYCADSANDASCTNQVIAMSMAAFAAQLMNNDFTHCSVPTDTPPKEMRDKVMAWLTAHPETHVLKTEPAVTAAIDATWPCK